MSWHYRSPLSFPALFTSALLKANEWPGDWVIIDARGSSKEIQKLAAEFRWFKWCITHEKTGPSELRDILEKYETRLKTREDEIGFILLVVARPTKLSEFERLNPKLASEIMSNVNE